MGPWGPLFSSPLSPDSLKAQGVLRVMEQKQYVTHESGVDVPLRRGAYWRPTVQKTHN